MKDQKVIPVVKCDNCDVMDMPPSYVCKKCGQTNLKESTLTGTGRVYSYTTIRMAPEAFRGQVPYRIALVDLAPGLRITARLEGDQATNIEIGQELFFDRVDGNGYWFHP